MNEFEVFERIKLRDKSAFDIFFRRYYTPLCKFSFAMCLSQEDAEESVQEMFVNLWEKAPQIEIGTSIKAYLYASTRNYTLNAIKKQQTEQHHLNKYSESEKGNDQEDEISSVEIAKLIQSGVETLPEKCREIFILCKQEGLTYDEIAAYLDVSKKTVDNQMGIALRKLRDYLQPKLKKISVVSLFTLTFLGVMLFKIV